MSGFNDRLILIFICLIASPRPRSWARGFLLIDGGGSHNIGFSNIYPGKWSDSAFAWALERVGYDRDFLIVYFEEYGDPGYWEENLRRLGFRGQVKVRVVRNVYEASDPTRWPEVYDSQTGIIWFPGGDQGEYVPILKGTALSDSIKARFFRDNICVGGTSAGAMIVGEFVSTGGAWPSDALRDAYSPYLKYEKNVLSLLPGFLIDTHVAERGRFGRMVVHLGRVFTDYGERVTVAGIDDCTALCVDSNLVATVYGTGSVTFLYLDEGTRTYIRKGKAPALTDVKAVRCGDRFKVDLKTLKIMEIPALANRINRRHLTSFSAKTSIFILGGKVDELMDQKKAICEFVNHCGKRPVIVVFTSSSWSKNAERYAHWLKKCGASEILVVDLRLIDPEDVEVVENLNKANGFIFVENDLRKVVDVLKGKSLFSRTYWSKVDNGAPHLFVGVDGMLVNQKLICNAELDKYMAYYGALEVIDGLGLMEDVFIVPSAFVPEKDRRRSYEFLEAKVDGTLWLLTYFPVSIAIFVDGGNYLHRDDESWVFIGKEGIVRFGSGAKGPSYILLDFADTEIIARSSWIMRDQSKAERQNGTLTPFRIHVLNKDFIYDLRDRRVIKVK